MRGPRWRLASDEPRASPRAWALEKISLARVLRLLLCAVFVLFARFALAAPAERPVIVPGREDEILAVID